MRSLKAQSNIIGAILIVVIVIGLIAVAFTFGLPFIQKNQDRAIEDRVEAAFNDASASSLPSKLKSVANNGGRDVLQLDVTGVTTLDPVNNSISFKFRSSVTSYAAGAGWVSLSGASCPPGEGVLGTDEPTVVCVRADEAAGGGYDVTFTMWVRELEDAEERNGFKINLLQHPASSLVSSGESTIIRIEFEERRPEVVGSKNLINTDVKILLV